MATRRVDAVDRPAPQLERTEGGVWRLGSGTHTRRHTKAICLAVNGRAKESEEAAEAYPSPGKAREVRAGTVDGLGPGRQIPIK